jgi:hypothetical protein
MIATQKPCQKCHAPTTYYRHAMVHVGKVVEDYCPSCGWNKAIQIWESETPSRPYTAGEVKKITAKIEAKALQLSRQGLKGGLTMKGIKAMHRVKNGLHKPYKTYKRRGGKIHESDFKAVESNAN